MPTPNKKPTDTMIAAAETVFLAMAATQTIRPIVEANQAEVLKANKYKYRPMIEGREKAFFELRPNVEYIQEVAEAYHMSDEDFADYDQKVRALNEAAGLKTEKPEFCPLLVAQDLQRKAERALIEAVKPVTNLSADDVITRNGLENYRKLIELTLNWIAPFCGNAGTILQSEKVPS